MKFLARAMLALILLATFGQPARAADEWRPFAANPKYEVKGHLDSQGVFRYTQSRLKASPGLGSGFATNGVKIERERLIEGSVRGTDSELARDLAEKDRLFHEREKVGQASPCPGPVCPKPQPHVPAPHVPVPTEREAVVIIGAIALAAVAAFSILILILAAGWYLCRALIRLCFAPGHQVD